MLPVRLSVGAPRFLDILGFIIIIIKEAFERGKHHYKYFKRMLPVRLSVGAPRFLDILGYRSY